MYFKSVKTNTSLYNGQPIGTTPKCYCVEVTSSTPSIQEDKNRGEVENVYTHSKQWFVPRVSYGKVLKAKDIIDARNIESYVPMLYKQITKHGKKHIIAKPLNPSFIFVHSSLEEVDAMLHDKNVHSIGSRPLLSYYFNHTSCRQDNSNRNPSLVIRDEAKDNFIKLTFVKNSHVIPVTSENIQYKLGDHVIVTKGDFEGNRHLYASPLYERLAAGSHHAV